MEHRAYLFEAKGIQHWIMEGGRLRDIATASNMLARCFRSDASDMLTPILAEVGLPAKFSRRAGGAFMLHYTATDHAAFDRFRALWRLVFMQSLAGLEFVEAFGKGATPAAARDDAYAQDKQERRRAGRDNGVASLLPYGHPLVAFSPRTGRPAVPAPGVERIDNVTWVKRRQTAGGDTVGERFAPGDKSRPPALWPNQMDDDTELGGTIAGGVVFPFDGEDRWIAVMHADISALGRFYAAVAKASGTADPSIDMARDAAAAIELALMTAAQKATSEVLTPMARGGAMPARPIVLGGDDVTVILRGDVALPFTDRFLVHLETETESALSAFAKHYGLCDLSIAGPLTAAAGVAFGKAKQPFFRLLDLAEELCGYAKRQAKQSGTVRPPSVVAFLRVTESALAKGADDLFQRLSIESGAHHLHAQPYLVGQIAVPGFIKLADLDELRRSLADSVLKSGGLREIRTMLLQGLDGMATDSWRRWLHMAERRSSGRESFAKFRSCLARLLDRTPEATMSFLASDSVTSGPVASGTPLFDAMEWNAIAGENVA